MYKQPYDKHTNFAIHLLWRSWYFDYRLLNIKQAIFIELNHLFSWIGIDMHNMMNSSVIKFWTSLSFSGKSKSLKSMMNTQFQFNEIESRLFYIQHQRNQYTILFKKISVSILEYFQFRQPIPIWRHHEYWKLKFVTSSWWLMQWSEAQLST